MSAVGWRARKSEGSLNQTVSTSDRITVPREYFSSSRSTMRGLLDPIRRNFEKSARKSPDANVSSCLHRIRHSCCWTEKC